MNLCWGFNTKSRYTFCFSIPLLLFFVYFFLSSPSTPFLMPSTCHSFHFLPFPFPSLLLLSSLHQFTFLFSLLFFPSTITSLFPFIYLISHHIPSFTFPHSTSSLPLPSPLSFLYPSISYLLHSCLSLPYFRFLFIFSFTFISLPLLDIVSCFRFTDFYKIHNFS